jgi:hypothetical protein
MRKVITDSGWEVVEVLDHGHARNSMERRIDQWNRTHNQLFHGIREKIERWFVILTSTEVDPEVQVRKWPESHKQYTSDHISRHHGPKSTESCMRSCGGRPDDIEDLREFFRVTSAIVGNELFHRLKKVFLQKEKKYWTSHVMRLDAPILQWNEPES